MTTRRWTLGCAGVVMALAAVGCGGGGSSSTGATAAAGADSAGCSSLTYTINAAAASGNPYASGDKVCFLASTTKLEFSGKSLTAPTQNTAVLAPNAAYTFTDGSGASMVCYEVAFTSGNLREINVGKGASCTASATFNFQGQFK